MSRQILINVPDQVMEATDADAMSFARELPLLAAIKLYELGRLSSGAAAELAGITRIEFLHTLAHYQIFPLEAELEDMETMKPVSLDEVAGCLRYTGSAKTLEEMDAAIAQGVREHERICR